MHAGKRSRRPLRLAVAIVVFVAMLGLLSFFFLNPKVVTILVALAGLIGGSMVVYDVRLTKRIAQAEFIRDLNDGFTNNRNISKLWKKLLLDEPITLRDRPRVSSFLTFFEAVHIMIGRGILDFDLLDNLFRNRFFRAVGNPDIQKVLVHGEAGSFQIIHQLAKDWAQHLRDNGLPLPDGHYTFLRAQAEAKNVHFVKLTVKDLPEFLVLHDQVAATVHETGWLRDNNREVFLDCLENQTALGARRDGQLIGAAILVSAGRGDENIQHYFTKDTSTMDASCNLKLVLIAPEAQGLGVGQTLVESLVQRAATMNMRHMLCTIHPGNKPSQRMFKRIGFERRKRVTTKYGTRNVFQLDLHNR